MRYLRSYGINEILCVFTLKAHSGQSGPISRASWAQEGSGYCIGQGRAAG